MSRGLRSTRNPDVPIELSALENIRQFRHRPKKTHEPVRGRTLEDRPLLPPHDGLGADAEQMLQTRLGDVAQRGAEGPDLVRPQETLSLRAWSTAAFCSCSIWSIPR